MKVYCKNCKLGKRGPCSLAFDKTVFYKTVRVDGREPIPGAVYMLIEEWDDCELYERKRWKPWVKRRNKKCGQ